MSPPPPSKQDAAMPQESLWLSLRRRLGTRFLVPVLVLASFSLGRLYEHVSASNPLHRIIPIPFCPPRPHHPPPPYRSFPLPGDPFHFIPCTRAALPPPLNDTDPGKTWASRFDPDPENWSWGNDTRTGKRRGIYLCGYLDLPLDYSNCSDSRVVRLAVTKFHISGPGGPKAERTIILEPGGPGASGTAQVWADGELMTDRFSDGQFDVLGWDPRGVNASLPALACFPNDGYRDRWTLLSKMDRAELASPLKHLYAVDAMANATLHACWKLHGDFGRFVNTGYVARDLDEIRKALGEDELTGLFVSYGTSIGQTYANMYPDKVGRLILDGCEYVKYDRLLGGFAWTALQNVTDVWRQGLLGECLRAGPDHCALAKPTIGKPVTLSELESRMDALFQSLIAQPMPGYTERGGPLIIAYSQLINVVYMSLYHPSSWPKTAQMLFELEAGNSTLAANRLENNWYHPEDADPHPELLINMEAIPMVVCADSYDAPRPEDGLLWWDRFWANLTELSWMTGTEQFSYVLPCRHYNTYWPEPPGVYRGDLNNTLKNPVLLISSTHDPATPLHLARTLAADMGYKNSRLIVHHGYGHSSRFDLSNCTIEVQKRYMRDGVAPEDAETHCHANKKPYLS
ncbi:Alpha/Beta hydrolase protein [Pseudoneurospora amorphoporcata]|uniref:Alpha/Beta hydrolase protein n=1 Tax=Pseudoneurospora amorphoporcata TaxID=241081 RepID=A0AAN6NQB5_9PEZI|nr:Alpha/Beta hydrolase protein [Pseudoneurospora amorphoporcata]